MLLNSIDWHFIAGALTIVLIDLLLAGDNAVVIALAVQRLSARERWAGIAVGSGLAVILRVGLTLFAARLLQISFLKLIGGALILWIAVKLFKDADPNLKAEAAPDFWRAIRFIVIADITMSIDNVLAIAAASKGNFYLLIFGLGLSIPLVVFTSGLLSILMERYPFIIYLGAAILGKVGAEMIMTDPFVIGMLHPSPLADYAVQAVGALAVVVAGKAISRRAAGSGSGKPPHKDPDGGTPG